MASSANSKAKTIGLWAFKGLIALLFIGFGSLKLMGMAMLVREFEIIGLGQGFRILTGVIEVGGAVALVIPAISRFEAPTLLCVSIGAFVAQATRLHGDLIHTLVLIAATGALTWLAWKPQIAPRVVTA
jgi:uncharacterized membrane protein YphA (DoxX/SURF4 family)